MFGLPLAPIVITFAGLLDFVIVAGIYLYVEKLKKKCDEVRRKWPQVRARILSSHVKETSGETGRLYGAVVRYEYTIDGRRFESKRLSVYPSYSSNNRGPHQEFVARFPQDREVDVWVNPRDPADALLTLEGPGGNWIQLVLILLSIIGVVTVAIGIGFALFKPHFPA